MRFRPTSPPRRALLTAAAAAAVIAPAVAYAGAGGPQPPQATTGDQTTPAPPTQPLRATRTPRYLTITPVYRGARVLVTVSGVARDRADQGRTVQVLTPGGATLCQTRVPQLLRFEVTCPADRLVRRQFQTVTLTVVLPATDTAERNASTVSRTVSRPVSARLVEGVGFPPALALGSTRAQVLRTWGKPNALVGISPGFRGGRIASILIVDATPRTAKGIGIGSTRAAVVRAYPAARCGTGPTGSGFICFVQSTHRGARVEMYFRGSPRVNEISIHPPGAYAGISPVAPAG